MVLSDPQVEEMMDLASQHPAVTLLEPQHPLSTVVVIFLKQFEMEYLYEKWRKDRNNRKNVEWMKDCATSPRSWRVGSPWNSQTRIPVRNRDPDRIGMMKRALNSINNSNSSNPNDTPLHFLFTCWLYEI